MRFSLIVLLRICTDYRDSSINRHQKNTESLALKACDPYPVNYESFGKNCISYRSRQANW